MSASPADNTQAVEVFTRRYEAAHGRRPRGTGLWAFFFVAAPVDEAGFAAEDDDYNGPGTMRFFNGSFTEARRKAVAFARTNGYMRIEVGS